MQPIESKKNISKVKKYIIIILAIIGVLILLDFMSWWFLRPISVRMEAMYPTLEDGDMVLTSRFEKIYKTGDIVIIEAPDKMTNEQSLFATYNEDKLYRAIYLKRIIGVAGDKLTINGDVVSINDEILNEPYINTERHPNPHIPNQIDIEIPEGYVFCMGDNRDFSFDSRNFGLIPIDKVEGKVTFRIFPFDKFGNID